MAAARTAELYLQIGANISQLQTGSKAAQQLVRELGVGVLATADQIEQAMDRAGGGATESLRNLERNAISIFKRINADIKQLREAPSFEAAVSIVDTRDTIEAARAAENQAQALNLVAEAAARAALSMDGDASAAAAFANNARIAALTAEQEAVALRNQANALQAVEAELSRLPEFQREVALANKSAADSFRVFEEAGLLAEETATRTTHAFGGMGIAEIEVAHIVRATGDSLASGMPWTTVVAEQLGRVIETMQLLSFTAGESTGVFGRFVSFMGGPWGIAIAVFAAGFAGLSRSMFENKAETERLHAAQEEYSKFLDTMPNFIDKVTGSLREQNKELLIGARLTKEKALAGAKAAAETSAREAVFSASRATASYSQITTPGAPGAVTAPRVIDPQLRALIEGAGEDLDKLATALKKLRAARPDLRDDLADPIEKVTKAIYARREQQKLESDIGNLDLVEKGGRALSAQVVEDQIKRRTARTPVERQQIVVDDLKRELKEADDIPVLDARNKALAHYGALLEDAERKLKSLQDAQKTARRDPNQQIGRQVTLEQAEDIVRGIGGRITSARRSYAEQAALYARYQAGEGPLAAKPGTSYHELGEALDVAKTAGMTLGKLKQAFRKEGVRLTEALDEGDHYHVAFGRRGPKPKTADQIAARDATLDNAYQGEVNSAQNRLAHALVALADNAEGRLRLELDDIQLAYQERVLRIDDQVKAKKINAAQAEKLKWLAYFEADAQTQATTERAHQQLLDDQLFRDKLDTDNQIKHLQLKEYLADTLKERRDIQLQILDLETKEARDAANRKIASNDPKVQAQGRAELAGVNASYDLNHQKLLDNTQDPLAALLDKQRKASADMNTSLKGVAADGLQSLESGLAGIISGTESVGSAFKKMANSIIADLARIAIEKAVVAVFSSIGFKDGTVPGYAMGHVPAYADGIVRGPGTGTSDSILAWLSNGEAVINARSTAKHRQLLGMINDDTLPAFAGGFIPDVPSSVIAPPTAAQLGRGGAAVVQQFDLRGSVVLEDLYNQMRTISAQHAVAAAQAGAAMAQSDLAERQFQRIP